MTQLLVITDPTDTDLFHTDASCDGLHRLVVWAERRSGEPLGDPAELVEAAAELGLLVESGALAGERWCRQCRAGAQQARRSAAEVHALAA
jgi:EAL domain-containing protein (putative c-di-GMP-specific phosphodiesterase class I)